MFGVVVCPRCKRAKAVELAKKTTTCPCGFKIRIHPRVTRFQAASAREVAKAVGRIQAEIHGGTDAVEPFGRPAKPGRDAMTRVIAAASRARDRRQRMRAAAEGLAREFVAFSRDDWRHVAEALGIPDPDGALEELARLNIVYEPRPGYYRTV